MTIWRSAWFAAVTLFAMIGTSAAATIDLGKIFDVGKDVVTAATGVNEKDEIAAGRKVAGRLLGAVPLVNDPDLQSYVNRVGRWVASQSERPDLPWHFGVIDNSDINAFASPGGYILITRGLYEILDDEAQLAGVLGHEISHVVMRHHITVMRKSAAISAGAKLAERNDRSQIVNNLIGTGAEIFARGLDKNAEFEADRLGVILAARAGYMPFGLVEVLHKLEARGTQDPALALMFETHPSPTDRLAQLSEALTPHIAELSSGSEPQIHRIAAAAAAAPAAKSAPPPGAKALRQPASAADSDAAGDKGIGIDPGALLKGFLGR